MEPEIIRMYSSSPPPLDSVADDEDDDGFGEFGGFSDVGNSGMGFADFDTVGYPKTREDFIPSKHFLPIHDYSDNVNNFSSLTSITANENISEIGISKKGPCSVFEPNINHDATQINVAALDNNGSSGENDVKYLNSETHLSCVDNDNLISSRSQEQIVSTCNGERAHSLEDLTNGFTVVDGDNPQGLQDLDRLGHSKAFKSISSHSTDLSIDFSPPSPGEDFADFATFSNKYPLDTHEAQAQPPKGPREGLTQSVTLSTETSRFGCDGVSATTEVLQDPFPQEEIEETDTFALDGVPPHEMASATLDSDSMHSLDTKNTSKISQSTKEEEQTLGKFNSCDESLETSDDVRKRELDTDVDGGPTMNVSPNKLEFEAFGDFDAAVPVAENVTLHNKPVHEPLELPPNAEEVNYEDVGSFEDTNVVREEETGPLEKMSSEDAPGQWASEEPEEFSDFGGFVSLAKKEESNVKQESDDFADFSTAAGSIQQPSDWNAFEDDQGGSSSWAAFGDQKMGTESDDWQSFRTDIPSSTDDQVVITQTIDLPAVHEPDTTLICDDSQIAFQNPLLGRLERVIQSCFSIPPLTETDEKVSPLDLLLCTEQQEETSQPTPAASLHTEVLDIWTELQDIHDAYGLKYQWGGSHSNKKLLRSLGIDTRNILFTGNKKQPVIVPMYAAGLGMLEPTKEPLKPLSAAEKIASIGQSSPVPPDDSICSSDHLQESLPPVQFDWSSSGLTNPLDASGGSTLLNLDFFGPVDDIGFSSTTTIPGVDPELYALTTAKVECSNASSKVTDAFARLMSTAETTSTSARKPRRDENLSEEAAKVIASLPDLSFMHAKVLMFPVSLTPLTSSQDKVD